MSETTVQKQLTLGEGKRLLTRVAWLAFQASKPMGLGFMHTERASNVTEADIAKEILINNTALRISFDYHVGRMIKTVFTLSRDGTIRIDPETPRQDYQSWYSTYPTAAALLQAAEASLGDEAVTAEQK